MKRRSISILGLQALAFGTALVISTGGAEAGLLDYLFGSRPAAPQPSYDYGLDVTVRPRGPAQNARRNGTGPAKRAAHASEPTRAATLQTPMDIDNDPEWFLRDVTLRRGDIIVRNNGALIYEGARSAPRIGDFANLDNTRLLSKRARATIKQLVTVPREDLVEFVDRKAVKPTVVEATAGRTPPMLGAAITAAAADEASVAKARR